MPATVLAASLFERYSGRSDGFAHQLLSPTRGQFGGHPVAGEAGVDGAFADQILDGGTIDVVPGGVQTEGASPRRCLARPSGRMSQRHRAGRLL